MNKITITTVLIFALLITSNLLAQSSAKITGTVVDSETGETLIGVNVVIDGTIKGTATDIDGRYTIRNVEPGTYTLVVSYLSFSTQRITGVVVEKGATVVLDVALQAESELLEEIIVTADVVQSNEAGLLSIQRKSIPVQDGISFEEISKGSDGNVGSAMKKVAGVSVVGGKDIYVRGLGNRYSNVQLNGAAIPSTNPNKKEAPVDILSSGIVENIIVQKTFTPDQSGEFSGGSVQIVTKEFPNDRNLGISYSTEINTHYSLQNYLGYNGGETDFLGYDDGFRSLPSDISDSEVGGTQEQVRIANALNDSWSSKPINSLPSQKLSISYADVLNQEKMPIGVVSNFSYKYETTARFDENLRYINNFNETTNSVFLGSEYTRNTGTEVSNVSAMLNVFVKPSGKIKLGIKNLYSNSLNNSFSEIVGTYYNFDGVNRQTVAEFDRRAVYSSTLNGETFFEDFFSSKLEVAFTYAKAVRDLPDRRTTQYGENADGNYEIIFPFRGNTHFFSFQDDNNYTAKLDYTLDPFENITVKTGGIGLLKERSFSSYKLVYQDLNNKFPQEEKTATPEEIFTADNLNSGKLDLIETSSSRDSYDGYQELFGGYASVNWSPNNNWNIEGGVRAEYSAQFIDNESLIAELDYLPALNATYRPTVNVNLRGAFSITLARPEFRELSNFNFQDFVGGRTVYGNPDLERTRIYNYDFRFEVFPNPSELLAISAFYKKFENPIEIFYRITQNNEVRYDNVATADLYGIELEGRKDLSSNLRVNTNFSYILSQVNYNNSQAVGRLANTERSMYGQSPYTLNVNAFYAIPNIDTDLTVSFNTFGKRISAVGNNEQPDDEYEQPLNKLDLSLTKKIRNTSVNVSIENLLGDDIVYKQGDVITNRFEIGTSFSVGISLNFN